MPSDPEQTGTKWDARVGAFVGWVGRNPATSVGLAGLLMVVVFCAGIVLGGLLA